MAKGFAHIQGGQIIIATVSPTEIGAKTNALLACFGTLVTAKMTDKEIDVLYNRHRLSGSNIIEVEVNVKASKFRSELPP